MSRRVSNSKTLKAQNGLYTINPPPKCIPYPPVYGYMYASAPKAVNTKRAPTRPFKKSDRSLLPGEYFNVMFDPRVYRGKTYESFKTVEKDRCILAARQAQRREILKKRKSFRGDEYKVGGIVRPKTPPPKERDLDREVTLMFLTEHTIPVDQSHQQIQTETYINPIPIQEYLKVKSGMNASTQIEDWELFDFEEEIGVLAPIMTEKILEQSLIETMEEEEQIFVRGVCAAAQQKMHVVRSHLQVIRDNEKEFVMKAEARRLELIQEEVGYHELTKLVEIICFTQSYIGQLVPSMPIIMHKEGMLRNLTYEGIKAHFEPWLTAEVHKEFSKSKIARQLIDDVLITATKQRAAAVLGEVNLEIDFGAVGGYEQSLTHIFNTREIVLSDSNPSDSEGYKNGGHRFL